MSRPVYSTRFIATQNVAAGATYEVPPGFVAVVRDLDAWISGTPSDISIVMENASLGVIFFLQAFTSAYEWIPWRGRQVLQPGEVLELETGPSPQVHATVSGYLLTVD